MKWDKNIGKINSSQANIQNIIRKWIGTISGLLIVEPQGIILANADKEIKMP